MSTVPEPSDSSKTPESSPDPTRIVADVLQEWGVWPAGRSVNIAWPVVRALTAAGALMPSAAGELCEQVRHVEEENEVLRASLAALIADIESLVGARTLEPDDCTCLPCDLRRVLANHKGDQS